MTQEPTFETERRFLVSDPSILDGHEGVEIVQAYIGDAGGWAYRVRRTILQDEDGSTYEGPFVDTWKGPKDGTGTRRELERELPEDIAVDVISAFPNVVTKFRYFIVSEDNTFEVDRFTGSNEGLIIAEFEASPKDVARMHRPHWCSEEVTHDPRYNNENLATRPWGTWAENRLD